MMPSPSRAAEKINSDFSPRQQRPRLYLEDAGSLPQVAQVNIVIGEVFEILELALPDLRRRRLAAAAFPHLADELIVRHADL